MFYPLGQVRVWFYALALLVVSIATAGSAVRADDIPLPSNAASQQPPEPTATPTLAEPTTAPSISASPVTEPMPEPEPVPAEKRSKFWSILPKSMRGDAAATSETAEAPEAADGTEGIDAAESDDHVVRFDQMPTGDPMDVGGFDNGWTSQWVPTGIIYHSYMAGPHEPRCGIFMFSDTKDRALADATLGGRMGFWRYGTNDAVHPEGFQVDFYGAAIARLDLKNQEDLDSCDYVFGLPFTYGNEVWQMKLGYAHLSSHLGDEFAISHPGALANRVNYSRDSIVWGNSYYVTPACRLYGEIGYAVKHDIAGPWTTQFGTEISRPGPTGDHFAPFLAVNGRVRDDDDQWMGDVNFQAGWLRRGILGQTLRFGLDYYNGKSDQSQFYNVSEQQIGIGLWYDF